MKHVPEQFAQTQNSDAKSNYLVQLVQTYNISTLLTQYFFYYFKREIDHLGFASQVPPRYINVHTHFFNIMLISFNAVRNNSTCYMIS